MVHRYARRLTVASLVLALAAGGVAPAVHASTMGHSGGNGNGRSNRNIISINSPNDNNGIQNVANTVVGGAAPTQNAICKRRFRHCRIVQRLIVDP
jgi:hypothetical protein